MVYGFCKVITSSVYIHIAKFKINLTTLLYHKSYYSGFAVVNAKSILLSYIPQNDCIQQYRVFYFVFFFSNFIQRNSLCFVDYLTFFFLATKPYL